MARSLSLLVVAAGIGGAIGLFVMSAPKPLDTSRLESDVRAQAAAIEAFIGNAKTSTEARAAAFSGLQPVRSAVGTSVETVADMKKRGELNLPVEPGETIVLGRIVKATGKAEALLTLPEDGTVLTPALGKPGLTMMMAGRDHLGIAKVVVFPSKYDGADYDGFMAVARVFDLAPLRDKIARFPYPVRVDFDGALIAQGSKLPAIGKPTRESTVANTLGADVKVVAEAPVPSTDRQLGFLGGAGGALLLGLILGVAMWRKKSDAAPLEVTAADLGRAQTAVAIATDPALLSRARQTTGGPLTEGAQFGRYTLQRPLGSGGMAQVFLARVAGEAGFEKRVALKIMHAELTTDEKAVGLFLDEARLVSRLNHPNIVQITDLGREGAEYFIAMEFIDGADLDRLLALQREQAGLVPLREAFTIIRRLCDGLHAAHEARDDEGKPLELVHRDVKAENVLISRSGSVKIGDFGIAKANQQVHKTTVGELKGTAAYMAPEHRTGQAVDRRADLYGVGAIAYEVLTGTEVNLDLAMLAHLGKQGWPHLAPPSQLRPELPTALDAVIWKALSFERDDRYPSCSAFEEALERVADTLGLAPSDKGVAQWAEALLTAAASTKIQAG